MFVLKRDGTKVPFDSNKIVEAINKAMLSTYGVIYETDTAESIAETIKNLNKELSVEEIQDIVEKELMQSEYTDVAKSYILYRDKRNAARGNVTDKTFMEFLSGQSEYWNSENSNKDAKVVTTQRDYIAGIASTDIARRFLLPKEVCNAHDQGIIHQHDMDYLAQKALTNCCLINLDDMLQNGTVINGVTIDPQHRLLTATTVATQIITAVASSQYGGCTISVAHLAPYVRMSFASHYLDGLKYIENLDEDEIDYEIEFMLINSKIYSIYDPEYEAYNKEVYNYAMNMLKEEIKDAVQTFNYQINSMSTTNGQAPFLSVYMQIDDNPEYQEETALLIEEFLEQRILGMKNEKGVYVTQSFPKLLYVLDENNIHEDSKYYYLTTLAATCTAKRMVPDYISAKKMREYKVSPKTGTGDVFGCMGCRSFLSADRVTENYAKAKNYQPDKSKYWGRFNLGVTTINLADAALSSKGNFDKFWQLLEERCELCHKGLRTRINRLEQVTADVAPILWRHGALARLDQGESLHNVIHHGYATASLGYAALYECVKYMTGEDQSQPKGKEFGLKVMRFLNDKCNQWKNEEDIDYSLYGSPIESTTYKFAKCLKKRFGDDVFIKLDGQDRNYVTNSYHYPVFKNTDIFSKLSLESEFQQLSPGGAISYGECADLTHNIEAVLTVMKYIYDHIMYAELNTKSDYCQVCGYSGEILIDDNMNWYCPNCGNTEQGKMNVARRTCG